jgi:hypothetical protein
MQEEIKVRFNSGNALSQMCQTVLSYLFLCKCTKYEKVKFLLLFYIYIYIYIYIRKLNEKITLVQTQQNKMLEALS